MRKLVSVISLAALASVSQVQAAEPASKEEIVGVSSGAIIGAVAGGPVGFVVGAAIGAKLGDSVHDKNQDIEGLRSSLNAKDVEVNRLQAAIRGSGRFRSVRSHRPLVPGSPTAPLPGYSRSESGADRFAMHADITSPIEHMIVGSSTKSQRLPTARHCHQISTTLA